jgi:hypothetical protein
MKKVLKITESQYKSLLLSEQGDAKFDMMQNQKNRESLKNKKQNGETGFKMDYNKLKTNPTPEYIATVLKNSEGFFGDNEAWAQAAFESIKDRRVYNEVSSLLGDDAYSFVKGFMNTDEEYHTKGKTIDGEFRRISPPTYHYICNNGMGVKSKSSKFGGSLTIPNHSENCVSCDTKINQYCKSRGELATIVTEKGSYWDDYFGLSGEKEQPINGGHWDGELYSYCVCRSGEAKTLNTTNNSSAVFFVEEGPSIKQGYDVSPQELENRRKIFLRHRKKEKEYNIDNTSIYEAFDCSEYRKSGDYWRYQQCVTDNLSMAVSVVPGIGTAVSAILDFANGFSYLGHALFGGDDSATSDVVMAAISFASIIPGFGEARSIMKMSPKSTKVASNIVQELHKMGGLKNLDSVDKVVFKHTKGLTEKQKNNVGKVINNLKGIDAKQIEKQSQIFEDIVKTYEKDGIERHTINQLMQKPNFIKILNNNGNDINKALKSKQFKTMLINMGVQFGFGGGISKYQTLQKKNEKEKQILKDLLSDKGYDSSEQKEIFSSIEDIKKEFNVDGLEKEFIDLKVTQMVKDMVSDDSKDSTEEIDDKLQNQKESVAKEAVEITIRVKNMSDDEFDIYIKELMGESIMKTKKIKITESQYKRLFNESSTTDTTPEGLSACKENDKVLELENTLKKYSNYNTEIRYTKKNDACMIKLASRNTDYYSYFFLFTKPVRKLIIKSPDGVFLESSPWVNMGNDIKIAPSVLNYTTNKRELIGNFTSFDKMVEYYENIIKNNTLTDNEVDEIAGNFNTYISNENLVSLKKVWDDFTITNKCKVISAYHKKFNEFLFDDINYTIWDKSSNEYDARESLLSDWKIVTDSKSTKGFCCNNYQVCY